jgi:hypothetical protein
MITKEYSDDHKELYIISDDNLPVITLDYDDVDHDLVDKFADFLVTILNLHFEELRILCNSHHNATMEIDV